MKFQNNGAVPALIAPLLFNQPRNQNQFIGVWRHNKQKTKNLNQSEVGLVPSPGDKQ